MREIVYQARVPKNTNAIICPGGMQTPYGTTSVTEITGGAVHSVVEQTTAQPAFVIHPDSAEIKLVIGIDETSCGKYADSIFETRDNRFTRFASELANEAQEARNGKTGVAAATAIACATAERFTYGHPQERFNDGFEEIPALGCGLVEGSCVDINTYFIAALRAAGFEAGYVTGFFFPEEKRGRCRDGHCWVVTRIDGETREWDIAHHLKLGTRDIKPGLNPKPGYRAACFHSMGLSFAGLETPEIKALLEPMAIVDGKAVSLAEPTIFLSNNA